MRRALFAAVCALLTLPLFQTPGQAKEPPDSDGKVPIRYYCNLGAHWSGKPNVQSGALHHRTYRYEGDKEIAESTIWLNWCWLVYQGAGPYDLYRILKHEMAHAKEGWRHGEGTPEENAAYDGTPYRITGF